MRKLFHYRENNSFLNRINPVVKSVFLLFFCAVVSTASVFVVAVCSVFVVVLFVVLKIPAGFLFREGRFFVLLALFMFVSSFFAGIRADSEMPAIFCTAAIRVCRYLNVVLASLIFTDCTGTTDLLFAFGKKKAGLAAGLSLAMIPVLFDCVSTMLDARKARGERIMKNPVKILSEICVSVIAGLTERSDCCSDALAARGFGITDSSSL